MNKFYLLSAAGLVFLLAGCSPTMSQTKFSKEELSWQKSIRDNYAGYCPPRTSAPAIQERESMIGTRAVAPAPKPNVIEPAQPVANEDVVVEEFKPTEKQQKTAKTVDEAAEKTAEKKDAPKKAEEAKKEVKKDAPKKAEEAKKEVKKDAPKKAEEAKKEAPVAATEYIVLKGDTLGKIAQKFYGDAQKFELIVKANPKLTDPKKLKVGEKIQIPRY